jgi:hypothetical protein
MNTTDMPKLFTFYRPARSSTQFVRASIQDGSLASAGSSCLDLEPITDSENDSTHTSFGKESTIDMYMNGFVHTIGRVPFGIPTGTRTVPLPTRGISSPRVLSRFLRMDIL